MEAFDEAVRRLKLSYTETLQYEVNARADFHLVLTVDRPAQRPEGVPSNRE